MCKQCIDTNRLVSNDEDGYFCTCNCRIKDLEFDEHSLYYNSERNYSTNLKCSKCNHFVVIRYGQHVVVKVIEK